MNAPAHWARQATRACNVCSFGRDAAGKATRPGGADAAKCICPSVTGRNLPREVPADWPLGVPVLQARDNHGACGPEAHHQAWPGF